MRGIDKSGVLITGGCGDIGLAVAGRFLEAGARVVLADLFSAKKGKAAVKKLESPDVAFVSCDVTRAASVDAAFAGAMKFLGRLDTVFATRELLLTSRFSPPPKRHGHQPTPSISPAASSPRNVRRESCVGIAVKRAAAEGLFYSRAHGCRICRFQTARAI